MKHFLESSNLAQLCHGETKVMGMLLSIMISMSMMPQGMLLRRISNLE